MVDLSINYCIDLRNGRCSSLDRSAEFKSQQHQIRNDSEDIVHHNATDDDVDLHETYCEYQPPSSLKQFLQT